MSVMPGSNQFKRQTAKDVLHGREPEILNDIVHPGIAAAIWQRKPLPEFQNWLDQLLPQNLPVLRAVTGLDNVESVIHASCDQANLPDCDMRQLLVQDALALAVMAANIMGSGAVRIRFDVSNEVMCPKFHIDAVYARLLCTYRGTGTQYVAENQISDESHIRSVPTGSAALFRGSNWPSEEETGLLHRSPPADDGGNARLLLVVDPLETDF